MSHVRLAIAASLVVAAPSLGAVTFFTDHSTFHNFNTKDGKVLKGIETFEESTIEQGGKAAFPNSLQNGVPRPSFPEGIEETNLIIQSNITQSPVALFPNPSGNPNALFASGPGFIGGNSVKVGTDEFLNNLLSSLDLIFTTPDKTGIGVDLSRYSGYGNNGFIIGVFDNFNNLLGVTAIPGPVPTEPAKVFFGVWSDVTIGRVNIWGDDMVPSPFAVDNIEMWVPAPGAAMLLTLSGLIGARRRR